MICSFSLFTCFPPITRFAFKTHPLAANYVGRGLSFLSKYQIRLPLSTAPFLHWGFSVLQKHPPLVSGDEGLRATSLFRHPPIPLHRRKEEPPWGFGGVPTMEDGGISAKRYKKHKSLEKGSKGAVSCDELKPVFVKQ